MAHTGSAMLSRGQSVIAVAGATGRFGYILSETLLSSPFSLFFSRVITLVRDPSSEKAQFLKEHGAEVLQIADGYTDPVQLREALKGIDVLVSALNRTDGKPLDALAEAAVDAGVVVYFPAEYGTDHRYDGLPMHKEWAKKEKHFKHAVEYAQTRQREMKIISVYAGPFTEDSIDSRYGIDFDARTITTYGSPSTRITFTTKADLARSIAQLAILSMSPSAGLADSVPPHVRIAGYSPSMIELADVLQRLSGGNEYKIIQAETEPIKKELIENHGEEHMEYLPAFMRVLIGEGKMDFSQDNSNELVNPRQQLWTWATLEDFKLVHEAGNAKVKPRPL